MRRNGLAATTLFVVASTLGAQDLVWQHKGYAALLDAAAQAQEANKRILVGLSGSDT